MNHSCECGHSYKATPYKLSETSTLLVGNCPLCKSVNMSLSGNPASSILHAVYLADLFAHSAYQLADVLNLPDPFNCATYHNPNAH